MKKLQGTPFTIKKPETQPALTPKENPISQDLAKKYREVDFKKS